MDPSRDFHMESTADDTQLQSKDILTPAMLKSAARLLKPESDRAELLLPDAVADGEVEAVDEDSSCSCSWLVAFAQVASVIVVRVLFNVRSAH